jgi:hypothetical protein
MFVKTKLAASAGRHFVQKAYFTLFKSRSDLIASTDRNVFRRYSLTPKKIPKAGGFGVCFLHIQIESSN